MTSEENGFSKQFVLYTVLLSYVYSTENTNESSTRTNLSQNLSSDENPLNLHNIYGEDNQIIAIDRNQDIIQRKQSFDDFTMKKRKTHFTLPPYNREDVVNKKRDKIDKSYNIIEKFPKTRGLKLRNPDNNYKDQVEIYQERNKLKHTYDSDDDLKASIDKINIINKRDLTQQNHNENSYNYIFKPFGDEEPQTTYNQPYRNKFNNDPYNQANVISSNTANNVNNINVANKQEKSRDINVGNDENETKDFKEDSNTHESYFNDPKFIKIMRQQTELMGKLLDILENDELRNGNAFDELIDELEKKKNDTQDSNEGGERITESVRITEFTTTVKPSTVIALIDETEVRNALKKDPFIKRILKLAGKRRLEYFKRLKLTEKKEALKRDKEIFRNKE